MSIRFRFALSCLLVAAGCLAAAQHNLGAAAPQAADEPATAARRPTAEEARGRAELLHEAFHAVLQVVHRQYYREDEGLTIPAVTLKKVFGELSKEQEVELRWLAVDAQAMNTEHLPRTDFERRAVAALAAGNEEHVEIESGVLRRAAAICLTSECLKCHAPRRTSTDDRSAGLVISLPIRPNDAAKSGTPADR